MPPRRVPCDGVGAGERHLGLQPVGGRPFVVQPFLADDRGRDGRDRGAFAADAPDDTAGDRACSPGGVAQSAPDREGHDLAEHVATGARDRARKEAGIVQSGLRAVERGEEADRRQQVVPVRGEERSGAYPVEHGGAGGDDMREPGIEGLEVPRPVLGAEAERRREVEVRHRLEHRARGDHAGVPRVHRGQQSRREVRSVAGDEVPARVTRTEGDDRLGVHDRPIAVRADLLEPVDQPPRGDEVVTVQHGDDRGGRGGDSVVAREAQVAVVDLEDLQFDVAERRGVRVRVEDPAGLFVDAIGDDHQFDPDAALPGHVRRGADGAEGREQDPSFGVRGDDDGDVGGHDLPPRRSTRPANRLSRTASCRSCRFSRPPKRSSNPSSRRCSSSNRSSRKRVR